MSEVKYTPEKWAACGSEDTLATWVEDESGKRVCSMRQCEQDWQRAQLIAAAPELLEALKWAVGFIETYAKKQAGPATPELNKCRTAIAKAEGN